MLLQTTERASRCYSVTRRYQQHPNCRNGYVLVSLSVEKCGQILGPRIQFQGSSCGLQTKLSEKNCSPIKWGFWYFTLFVWNHYLMNVRQPKLSLKFLKFFLPNAELVHWVTGKIGHPASCTYVWILCRILRTVKLHCALKLSTLQNLRKTIELRFR